jgi:Uma2 family endonuclease
MITEVHTADLSLVRERDGLRIDLDGLQGLWTEAQYLKLTAATNRLIEFSDGEIEVLAMPTRRHQRILLFLYQLFLAHVQSIGGEVLLAALRMRVRPGKFREPDLLLVRDRADPRNQDEFWLGADLTLEVVSPDDPGRDIVTKRADYAEAGIPEYWIVNPLDETITVLTLAGEAYVEHGVFARGAAATSPLLADLSVDVAAVFDAGA